MKKFILFVLLAYCTLVVKPQNLLINPGFEFWDKLTKPTGWTISESCTKDSSIISSGLYSCRQVCSAATSKYLGQNVSIIPGRQYQLSLLYRTVITSDGNGCRIWCYWRNSEGTNISDPATDNIMRPSKYLKSDIWQQFSISVTAPVGAVSFYLEVRTYPNSTAYWDDFSFTEAIISGEEDIETEKIIIYPNPVCEQLTISNLRHPEYIEIQSYTGLIIYSSTCMDKPQTTISLAGYPGGFYIIKVRCSNELIIRKFIKK